MMTSRLRRAAWPLLAAIPLTLAGCAAGLPGLDYQRVDTLPEEMTAPRPGGTLQHDFWELATPVDIVEDPKEYRIYFSWPLPLTYNKYAFDVSPDGTTARSRAYSMNSLGLPEIHLPLFFSTEYHYYRQGELEPAGSTVRRYNPFWSYSHSVGTTDDDVVLAAGGVPLVWESGYEAGYAWHFDDYEKDLATRKEFEFTTLLWWLGPAWQKSYTETPVEDGVQTTETRLFVPALLGKLPGLILWTDYTTTTTQPDGSSLRWTGHGPLGGLPTWFESHRRGPDAIPSERMRRYVLGGLLWQDAVRKDMHGNTVRASHGPLFGFIGWGRDREANNIRIFWMPVKI